MQQQASGERIEVIPPNNRQADEGLLRSDWGCPMINPPSEFDAEDIAVIRASLAAGCHLEHIAAMMHRDTEYLGRLLQLPPIEALPVVEYDSLPMIFGEPSQVYFAADGEVTR